MEAEASIASEICVARDEEHERPLPVGGHLLRRVNGETPAQIRAMMAQMRQALESGELDDFLGFGETLNILIQQHNMKEEQMLYPMCDRTLADRAEALLERMQAH